MPYRSNSELPKSIKDAIPSGKGRSLMREVINSQLSAGKSENVAFASAWAALERAGYEKDKDNRWKIKKSDLDKSLEHALKSSYEDDLCENLHKIHGVVIEKAEYQGETVTLDKPFRTPGESKKFAVYVKDGDKVKKVRFGDPNMEIRRDNEEARASFRARHNCDTAKDKTTARYWSCKLWDSDTVTDIVGKRQINDDMFTTSLEAKARSVDIGLQGDIHVYDMDGVAVYMPGASHEEYLARYNEMAELEEYEEEETNISIVININKSQEDQRLVFGWASVIEENGSQVIDSQEDTISEDELEKAFYDFVENSRKAGEMHIHSQAGELVEMMVFTKEKQKALGIDLGKVGAWVGFRLSPEIFNKVKNGEYQMFSIGGKGKRIKYA